LPRPSLCPPVLGPRPGPWPGVGARPGSGRGQGPRPKNMYPWKTNYIKLCVDFGRLRVMQKWCGIKFWTWIYNCYVRAQLRHRACWQEGLVQIDISGVIFLCPSCQAARWRDMGKLQPGYQKNCAADAMRFYIINVGWFSKLKLLYRFYFFFFRDFAKVWRVAKIYFRVSPKYFARRQKFRGRQKKKKDRKINITIYILRISQYLLCTNASPLQHNFFGTLGVIFPCGVIELLGGVDLYKLTFSGVISRQFYLVASASK